MYVCRDSIKAFGVTRLMGADVKCIDGGVSSAEIKVHESEEDEKPELHGAPCNVAANFWGLWALLDVIGITWEELLVLLLRPVERLLQHLWEVEVILMVVLLLWL